MRAYVSVLHTNCIGQTRTVDDNKVTDISAKNGVKCLTWSYQKQQQPNLGNHKGPYP